MISLFVSEVRSMDREAFMLQLPVEQCLTSTSQVIYQTNDAEHTIWRELSREREYEGGISGSWSSSTLEGVMVHKSVKVCRAWLRPQRRAVMGLCQQRPKSLTDA